MKKHLSELVVRLVFLALAVCMAQPQPAWAARSADVLVLPFQVTAGPDLPNAARDIPELIISELGQKGLSVLPLKRARALIDRGGKGTIDLAAARLLGKAANAKMVVYGNFTQLGEGFTMQTRIVPVEGGQAVPFSFERDSLVNLNECAAIIAEQAQGMSAGQAPTPDASNQSAAGLVPMGTPLQAKGGISDIQVRGLQNMDPDMVLMRLSISKGDSPDAHAINEEVKRIWEMGYFSDVQAAMSGSVLVFTVTEKPRIENILVEGNKDMDTDDIIGAMSTKSGNVLNEQILADDLQKVTELYRKEGFYLAKANYRLEDRQGGRGAILVVTVEEGNKLYIKEVKIEGLKALKQDDMEKYIAMKPRNIFSWFTGTGVLKDEYLERDTNAIAAYGLNEGYLDMQVSAPDVQYRPDGIHVIFQANEGPRYTIRNVVFDGDVIDTEDRMLEIVGMDEQKKDGKYFKLQVMQDDSKKLTEFYNDAGYAFAEIDTRPMKVEGEEHLVDVVYHISKKQRVFIRRLTLEGNTKTRDNVILREMRLGDGDQYEGAKLRRSTERLNRLRYFSAVDAELIPVGDGSGDEVDLKVKVKEDNTGAIMGGVGYSTMFDVGVSASIMERNLFGKGYWLQLQGFFSWRSTSGVLTFSNPRLYDTDLSVSNDLYYRREYWDEYSKDTIGDTIRISHPIGEYTAVGLGYRLENYELYDVNRYASRYITDYKGINWTSALSARITRDTTDSREFPTKGTVTRLWAEYGGGGLGGTDNFVKGMADWQVFYGLNPDHVLHARGRLGGVFQNSDDRVPVFERFYVGGMDTIRGYSYSDISPRDKGYYNDHIGGDRMGVFNIEYIYRFQKEMGLSIVPFFDGGFNIHEETMGDSLSDYIVYSAGLELRWRSPMGDIRVAYGVPLKEDYDGEMEMGRFEFTMGQFF